MKKMFALMSVLLLLMALSVPAFAAEADAPVEFPFTVVLTDADGNELEGEFEYTGTKTGTIRSGDTIYLGDADYIDILNLPEGTKYSVTEGNTEGYVLNSSANTQGVIEDKTMAHAQFVNKELVWRHIMPSSGGEGVTALLLNGTLMIGGGGTAAILLLRKARISKKK